MADATVAPFQRVWHALMTVFGRNHPTLWRRNRAILQDVNNLMRLR